MNTKGGRMVVESLALVLKQTRGPILKIEGCITRAIDEAPNSDGSQGTDAEGEDLAAKVRLSRRKPG